MRSGGTAKELEARRRLAVVRFQGGWSPPSSASTRSHSPGGWLGSGPPAAKRLGVYFAKRIDGDFECDDVVGFLRNLLKHMLSNVVVFLDGGLNHKGGAALEFLRWNPHLTLEQTEEWGIKRPAFTR